VFVVAPCKPGEREVATWNLVHVEAIPHEVLTRGITWDWETFPEYMSAAARRGLGINAGFLAPLSPFRHWVMGEEAMERAATPAETERIAGLLGEAFAAGAKPLACRMASDDELRRYARALGASGRGVIEIALTKQPSGLSDREYQLLDLLSESSGRPVTWLNLRDRDDAPAAWTETLERAEPLLRRGCAPQVAVRPLIVEFNLRNPFLFASMNSMKPAFGDKSAEAQTRHYSDAGFRRKFAEELGRRTVFHDLWERTQIKEVRVARLQSLQWKTIAQAARERGADPLDLFFDLAIEDGLATDFMIPLLDTDETRVAAKFSDPRTMIGISDGGAHVDMLCNAGYTTYLIGKYVRERRALSLEYAVKRITSEPAAFFGIADRGAIKPGMAADIVIFDLATVGCEERPEVRNDLPGGGRRLVTEARGVRYTLVNGEILFDGGVHSGATPGRVLRPGSAA